MKKGINNGLLNLNIKNIRDYSINNQNQVDDTPFGGGPGMLLRPEPLFDAFKSLNLDKNGRKTIYFSPKGEKLSQNYIKNLTNYQNIVLICGRYEGIDERVIESFVDDQVSVGDYVLTGGELPAMILIDCASRFIEGFIKKESLANESFSRGLLEHRQYTKPREYMGMKVPDVLVSGNHKEIDRYKLEDSLRETLKYRPDLIENGSFDENIIKIIDNIKKELENESYRSN
ncbi:MAG TPA: tRNA (guanosine(37)-N1)-methyltransferase TrmD [Spirochaetota bacterium]|nr:tRNA (guanosine(37)-N1)-methyltransferase TrmD [Spirochaetota bacterium]HOS31731.1 tRNA (guanosine(37)-N1)-methyltransferase TrmD [Spirochaetota bacterium]HOS54563.1 tRNA (guanosine(37)-N1)-methyltransferase TrmD [Spirochaetota bacterium]HPK61287.1 tRNA (guanosine(37)-N1)-methyltransferase TrmD [Spirochaetota bacterium]HQF77205.1 tRNA (guanosine(37)-N1)-methyltransferase TrmD [Spirochaetota bacterium]